jgi:hypothetical protein
MISRRCAGPRGPRLRLRGPHRTTRWRSCTCATWSVGGRRRSRLRNRVPGGVPRAPGRPEYFPLPLQPTGASFLSGSSRDQRWNISLFHYRNHGAALWPHPGRHAGARICSSWAERGAACVLRNQLAGGYHRQARRPSSRSRSRDSRGAAGAVGSPMPKRFGCSACSGCQGANSSCWPTRRGRNSALSSTPAAAITSRASTSPSCAR